MKRTIISTLFSLSLLAASLLPALSSSAQEASVNIIGGEFYPQFAGLDIAYIETGEGSCSGTLVGKREILTAAHCIAGGPGPSGYSVYVARQWRSVQSVWYHSRYKDADLIYRSEKYDLGMIILSQPVQNLTPTPILRGWRVPRGTKVLIAGYGTNELSGDPDRSFINNFKMGFSKVVKSTGSMLECSHSPFRASTCAGDSGGPVMIPYNTKSFAVVGVISNGTNEVENHTCYLGSGGYFGNVDLQSPSSRNFLSAFRGVRYAGMQRKTKR
jgi:secreted trypsin-like serine protease